MTATKHVVPMAVITALSTNEAFRVNAHLAASMAAPDKGLADGLLEFLKTDAGWPVVEAIQQTLGEPTNTLTAETKPKPAPLATFKAAMAQYASVRPQSKRTVDKGAVSGTVDNVETVIKMHAFESTKGPSAGQTVTGVQIIGWGKPKFYTLTEFARLASPEFSKLAQKFMAQ